MNIPVTSKFSKYHVCDGEYGLSQFIKEFKDEFMDLIKKKA